MLSVKVALFALVSFEGDKGARDVLVEEAPRDKSVSLERALAAEPPVEDDCVEVLASDEELDKNEVAVPFSRQPGTTWVGLTISSKPKFGLFCCPALLPRCGPTLLDRLRKYHFCFVHVLVSVLLDNPPP